MLIDQLQQLLAEVKLRVCEDGSEARKDETNDDNDQ
jgi:hypothetical protein